jgi:hypothetical protein
MWTVSELTSNAWAIFFFLNFRRQSMTSGWQLSALIVVVHNRLVCKQWTGQPKIESSALRVNPLGPLQEMGEALKVAP